MNMVLHRCSFEVPLLEFVQYYGEDAHVVIVDVCEVVIGFWTSCLEFSLI